MANGLNIHELAKEGATIRLEKLQAELQAIRRAFPQILKPEKDTPKKARHMSLKARKAVSERMTAYWANRRRKTA